MEAMEYEFLVRRAFGYKLNNGSMMDRYSDPASLANTDIYNSKSQLSQVKAATVYSMEILITEIQNSEKVPNDAEYDRLDGFANSVINAPDKKAVSNIIADFNKTVIDKYFYFKDGVMTLK